MSNYKLYEERLQGEYREAFKNIEICGITYAVDSQTMDEKMAELLDLLLEAQDKSQPVAKIVGSDMDRFAKNFFADVSFLSRIQELFDAWMRVAGVLLVFSGLYGLINHNMTSNMDNTDFLLWLPLFELVGFLAKLLAGKILAQFFKNRKMNYVKRGRILFAIEIIIVVICIFILVTAVNAKFITLPVWVVTLASALYLLAYYILNWRRVKEKANSKAGQNFFDENIDKVIENDRMAKDKKRANKGLAPLTDQEFMDTVLKEQKNIKKVLRFNFYCPLLIIILATLAVYYGTGFETANDMFAFIIILAFVEALVFGFMSRTSLNLYRAQAKWVKEQENV